MRDLLDDRGVWTPDSLALDTFSAIIEMESFFCADAKLLEFIIVPLKAFLVVALPPAILGKD